jgi:ketosteroid isomerase-like protein
MKQYCLPILICISQVAFNQNIQHEINDQVWKPFIKTFNDRDTKGFMSLHSKDAARSPRDAKVIWNWQEYFENQQKGDEREKSKGSKRELELRFTERIIGNDLAIDVGIYKTTSIRPDGIARSFYGRFHVVLRKENGRWKILVDTDSSESGTISEKEFLAAAALE